LRGFWTGWIDLRHGRAGQVGAGLRVRAICWKISASGQAEAKAMRTRLAVSMTRAATLISRSRMVANSATLRGVVSGSA